MGLLDVGLSRLRVLEIVRPLLRSHLCCLPEELIQEGAFLCTADLMHRQNFKKRVT